MAVKELGHVVLYVKDIEASRRFYGDVLGWHEIKQDNGRPMAVFSSGRTHHELLLIEVGPQAAPVQRGHHLGMYHFGLKVGETDEELKEVLETLVANNVKIVGASDHTVTHSLYIEDPDGNEIELYIDVQPAIWKDHPEAVVAAVKPLRL
jgi:catechol 2,3-dioxygenase